MARRVKKFNRYVSLLLVVLISAAALFAAPGANLEASAVSPINNAVQYLYNEYITNGPENSDTGVGAYALYVLVQAGVDVTAWEYEGTSLDEAVISAINNDLSDPDTSAKLLAQDLAAADELGEDILAGDLLDELLDRESSSGFDSDAYSDIPAYDLLGRTDKLDAVNAVYAKGCILSAQNTSVSDAAYGSFGSTFEEVFYPDFMTTAQAVRALQYLDPGESDGEIQGAIDAALGWLEDMQQDDGSFSGSDWDDPVIDTAEVVVVLDVLGMDPETWDSGGHTAVDYMMDDALNDDGSFGSSANAMDAIWALCAYNAMGETCTVWRFYLDPAGTELNVGGTAQLTAMWQNTEGSSDVTADAVWSVADDTIALVDGSGLVTALKAGVTEVSAVHNGLTASVGVTVDSGGGPGGGSSEIVVGLAVVGMDNELLYSPRNVSVSESNEWGLTALGALDASGLTYMMSPTFPDFVCSISRQDNSGMSGWMYTVNGVAPLVGAAVWNIKHNDKIIFYYSQSMDQEPPRWDDLKDLPAGSDGGAAGGLPVPLSDTDFNAAVKNAAAAGRISLKPAQNATSLALTMDQAAKVLDTGKPLAVTIQGAQFILSPESLEALGLADRDAAFLKFEAKKLSAGEAGALPSPSSFRLQIAGDVYELTIQVVNEDGTLRDIDQFPGCTVLLPVPAGMEEAAAAGRLTVYYYNEESGQWEEAGGTYDPDQGAVGVDVDHFSKYALVETLMETAVPPEAEAVFSDIAGHWARAEIEYMAEKGYVAGVGENLFAPESKITRAEFASILARMAGLEPDAAAAERFIDVPAGAWYQGTVGAVTTAGLVYGTSENSFAPEEPVTREQMAAMLVRLMTAKGSTAAVSDAEAAGLLAGFSDAAAISGWARSPVAQAVRDGLMVGRESAMFVPLGNATRAEATVVLYRALQKG